MKHINKKGDGLAIAFSKTSKLAGSYSFMDVTSAMK